MKLVYNTLLTKEECFAMLLQPQYVAEDDYYQIDYQIEKTTDSQLRLTYKGMKRFGKYRRSEYTMDFVQGELTVVILTFRHEALNFPISFTPEAELDRFMEVKIQAKRCK